MRLKKLNGVYFAIGTHGRDQRDRPRRDETGENSVSVIGKILFEIKFHE
jgi:hypothetical protein